MAKNKILLSIAILTGLFLYITGKVSGGADYAGPQVCAECHGEAHENFMKNGHAVEADPRKPAAKFGCESCHGPGTGHAEDEDINKILSLGPDSPLPAEKKNAACLACHENGKQSLWHGSEHESRGLSCSECHSIHSGKADGLSRVKENQLCIRCHKQIRSQLIRQSRHPLREGKIGCNDCHNPHGSTADKLIDAQNINTKCFECHAEKRGPFLWDHPPVTEDCQVCHTPHGSTRNALLKGRMPYLCQRCHSDQVHSGNLYARNAGQAN
ncbi:DmsE family decaheme c-type cytochrome, partial [Thermodesulfobacteriota bacterium]